MPIGDDFLRQLHATFMVEAREHVQTLSRGLLELEKAQEPREQAAIAEAIFRAAHSLKGAARAVELAEIEAICQSLEDVFAAQRRDATVPNAQAMDVLHRALDTIEALLEAVAGNAPAVAKADLAALRKELHQIAGLPRPPAFAAVPPPPLWSMAAASAQGSHVPPTAVSTQESAAPATTAKTPVPVPHEDTVRVGLPKLERQLLDTEELLVVKLAASQRVAELREMESWFKQWRKAWGAVEPEVRALRQSGAVPAGLSRLLDFCDWNEAAVRTLEARVAHVGRAARHDSDLVGKSVDNLLENAKKLLLLPFATISASFPKLVRDLCRAEGKEADLVITGEHVELDKRILEEMKDPLVHMLRNAVVHAVELPAVRTARGKPARATLALAVSQADGNRVQIVLSDDGAGIATEQIREAAVRRGLVSEKEATRLDEAGVQALIFRSDVSTSTAVTQLSGRGLGLAIVHENTQRLGGEVRVQSRPGLGTTFSIVLPAIRATFRGILCQVAGRLLLMPVALVERVARVRREDVRSVEGHETIHIEDRAVALVRLADVLEMAPPPQAEAGRQIQVLLVGSGDQSVAFAVDAVLQEQEVLVKPLRKPLVRVRNIAAAAVLGSGKVVPILNVADLMKSVRHVAPGSTRLAVSLKPRPVAARSILVAEDSITSRMLLKTILESAGYRVRTAVDGMEAFALLRSEPFDLLVSDVEMPRLNGFDLTVRVRADGKLAELPVVLVTALATREDRERGIDVGANAYIIKGSFDRDNLIEAVGRLI